MQVIDPCESTVLSFDGSVRDMLAYIEQEADTQTVHAVDSVSMAYGNGDGFTYCGPRTYSIVSPDNYPYLGIISDQLILSSVNVADVTGPQPVTISVSLVNYPPSTIAPAFVTVTIEIVCQVLSVEWTQPLPEQLEHVLLIDEIPITIGFNATTSPNCGSMLSYSLLNDT